MNKSKKNIIIVVFTIVALVFATFFIKKNFMKSDTETIRDNVYPYLEESEKNILEEIISTQPLGLYVYEVSNENSDRYYDKIYCSPDDRTLSVEDEHDSFYLQKDGYMYTANSASKKYFKEKIENYDNNFKEYNIEYAELVNSTGDGSIDLVDGLRVYKTDENYVVESQKDKKIFDQDAKLIEEDFFSDGIKSKSILIEHDPDFDKYFDQYYALIESYEEVNDVNKLDY